MPQYAAQYSIKCLQTGFEEMIPSVPNPINLFNEWFQEAQECDAIREPTAVTLATVDETGMPWARVVLLKDVSDRGFTIFTNTNSAKGRQLTVNPKASLCFYWMPIDKQVRVRGATETVSDTEADTYWATRPRESQLGAWASLQSEPLTSRKELEDRFREINQKFEGQDVPRPAHWSGYRIVPEAIEFWLKQPHRLHDRMLYTRTAKGEWDRVRLNP